jgi:cytidylate kinase
MWTFDDAATEPNYKEIEEMLEYITPKAQIAKGAHDVITISRQIGSGGDEIARKVCNILGFAYFDKNLMYEAAKKIGVCEGDITDFSEDSYKITSLVDKILGRKRLVSVAPMMRDSASIVKILDEEKCLDVVQTVINSLCGRGKIVIVGRGGQAILKNKVNVLHVRIVAPLDVRIERIMKEEGVTREEALKIITENDKATAEYLQRFYNIDWNDPTNYSMVLNTGKMDLDTAIKGIVLACKYGY